MVAMTVSCSKEAIEGGSSIKKNVIMATVDEPDMDEATRVSVEDATLAGGSFAYWWQKGDEIGVYTDAGENNVKYTSTTEEDTKTVYFASDQTVSGTPTYAYYPYNANAGDDYTAVKATFASVQTINSSLNNVPGITRYGYHKSTSDGVSSFGFKHVLSNVRIALDATDTKMAGCRVKSVTMKVVRNFYNAIPVCGDFTFNAETGVFTQGSNTSNEITYEFESYPTMENTLTFVTSLFPNIKKNDRIYFTVTGVGYTATFYVVSSITLASNYAYSLSLPFSSCKLLRIKTNDIEYIEPEEPTDPEEPEVPTEPVEPEEPETPTEPETPETPTEPTVTTGTFTAATYNVDGLPSKISFISINSDGPGSDGTTSISSKIAEQNWDFVGFSEDFNYNTELMSSLSSAFKFGTHRGTVSASNLLSRADTDGLQFATRNATCSYLSESWTQFVNEYGGLTSGANTCIKKGIRHYPVQLADGVVVDVIITHMNTYSDSSSSFINAQHGQLTEIAEYINKTMAANNRPIIFMGDTNCRYTRHDFATYFWGKLSSDLTYADPWVEFQWAGVYPTYGSKSLMVSDATGTNSETDIICSTTQNGEVVDKVIYINKASNAVQIKADSYLRDYDNFNGLADHMPIVVNFTWTKTVTE